MVATATEWDRLDDVPVKVMLPVALDAVGAAVRVIFCDAAGETLIEVGEAVTPEGRPETETEIDPLKELIAEAEMVMSDPDAPACRVTEVGEAESEKSGVGEEEGDPVPEVPDLDPPHDVRNTAQHNKNGRGRYLQQEPIFRRPFRF